MNDKDSTTEAAPQENLFSLDLHANGGVLAPTDVQELTQWISKEVSFWSWASSGLTGGQSATVTNALGQLHQAANLATDAIQYQSSNKSAFNERIENARAYLGRVYLDRGLPHSSTLTASRVDSLRKQSHLAAVAYTYVHMPAQPGENYSFDARDVDSWRGFLAGIFEKFGLSSIPDEVSEAMRANMEELKGKLEQLLGTKTQTFNRLHRKYEATAQQISSTEETQRKEFTKLVSDAQKSFGDALIEHESKLDSVRGAFKEKMSLRAIAVALGLLAVWVLKSMTPDKTQPDAWRVAVLILVGVLGIWAVRLLVRMFLSHTHLATDASERTTMVQTYLSLIEGGNLTSDEDRKLILQALFRPATDGLVKDEGLPHPFLEALTRSNK
jgi:Family of unknown function (DUF6161)